MERSANRRRRQHQIMVGDHVWLSTTNLRLQGRLSHKLAPKWCGPFAVVAQVSPVSFRLQLPDDFHGIHDVHHVSALKRHEGAPPGRCAPVFRPETEEHEFEVEAVTAKRLVRNRVEYLVSWRGYGPWDSTWEPEDNLQNAPEKVQEFELSGRRARRRS